MEDERRPSSSTGIVGFSGDYYRLLFDHAGFSMIGTDANFDIRSWNHAAGRMFGAAAGRMIGTPLVAVIPQEGREGAERALRQAIEDGVTSQFEFAHGDEHGRPRQIAVTVSPIPDRSGARIGALACFRDISQRIELAEQLAQQRKMVSLGEMAGALAHHFNNILGGIVTSVDFALETTDPDVRLRVLHKTAHALSRATGLVDSLLAFAEGDRRSADLGDLTEAIIELAGRIEDELSEQNIKLELEIEPIPIVPVPRKQFSTVMLNLVHNAVDAMPEGGTLTIGIEPAGDHLLVRVTDTGCGIRDEELGRIFEPFYSKPRPGLKGERRHEGLGLAVAHGMIKDMGGTITVASVPDQGATFRVRLPKGRLEPLP